MQELPLKEILIVMGFGAMGSLCRFGVGEGAKWLVGETFPFGTLTVNVLGCLLIGFTMEIPLVSGTFPDHWRSGVVIGFLGAFTTFSAFGYATYDLMRQGAWLHASVNCAANLLLGLAAVWVGAMFAKTLFAG